MSEKRGESERERGRERDARGESALSSYYITRDRAAAPPLDHIPSLRNLYDDDDDDELFRDRSAGRRFAFTISPAVAARSRSPGDASGSRWPCMVEVEHTGGEGTRRIM